MKKYKYVLWAVMAIFLASCSSDDDDSGGGTGDMTKQITINVNQTYQTIDGFAASDCWVPNYIGKYWSSSEKEDIARLLFSNEVVSGQPQGIALSSWRFNLGGGTAEQGAASGIDDVVRRAECFLQSDGTYDWTHQSGQQYFLDKAKSYGCNQFVMFSNTPPVSMTQNGKGYSARGSWSNLKEDAYDDFAKYMANVIHYFKTTKGINFSLVSPVNEPQYNWDGKGQEGSGWQNSEIKKLSTELDAALTAKNLDTKILLAEAADWEYLYKQKGDATRSNVIKDLFTSGSSNYVGNLTHIAPVIAGHSYWTDTNLNGMRDARVNAASAAKAAGYGLYQTEWSMLSDNYGDGYPGHDQASYMDIALYMAKVIYSDLTMANVSSWSFWTSMDMERWNHKSRFYLIKVTPAGGPYGDITQSGTHEASKNLWVLGNFSKFVRPGYKRVALDIKNPSNLFLGSAYISPDNKTLAVVYINVSTKDLDVKAELSGIGSDQIQSIKTYTTSETSNLKEQSVTDVKGTLNIKSQAVTTVVYSLK